MDLTPHKGRLKPSSLRIGYFNAESINTQISELREFLTEQQFDVFLVQETFLKPFHRNPGVANYMIVRNDRTDGAMGGTLIYYKRSLHCVPIDTPPLKFIEASACRLGMTGHNPITIVSAYLSPPSRPSKKDSENPALPKKLITEDLKALLDLDSSVLVAGDLNAKHPSWNSRVANPRGGDLERLAESLHFDVIAPIEPTHYPHNPRHKPDVLDVVLLKNIGLRLCSIEVLRELDSDHRPVIVEFAPRNFTPGDPTTPMKTRIDWEALVKSLGDCSSQFLESIPKNLSDIATVDDARRALDAVTLHIQHAMSSSSKQLPVPSKYTFYSLSTRNEWNLLVW